ncbi:hypothetical protein Bealeia1_00170 [Candidatus Bealeia paramacronuclearis]|uniref:Uncharacterized protein n=1 Tax=Candidatus Bealeia paramacronuclearis TaxID=1921001 RepID=A0ABZ2C3I4_9PROT
MIKCCRKLIEKSYRFILGDQDYENYQAEKAKFYLARRRDNVLTAIKTATHNETSSIVPEHRIRSRVQKLTDSEFRTTLEDLGNLGLVELKLSSEYGLTVRLTVKGKTATF